MTVVVLDGEVVTYMKVERASGAVEFYRVEGDVTHSISEGEYVAANQED